jgi:hypothetical protein
MQGGGKLHKRHHSASGVMRVRARHLVIGTMTAGRTAIATHVSATLTRVTCSHVASICPANATARSFMTPAIANTPCEVQRAAPLRRLGSSASAVAARARSRPA